MEANFSRISLWLNVEITEPLIMTFITRMDSGEDAEHEPSRR